MKAKNVSKYVDKDVSIKAHLNIVTNRELPND